MRAGRLGHRFQRHSVERFRSQLPQPLPYGIDYKASGLESYYTEEWLAPLRSKENASTDHFAEEAHFSQTVLILDELATPELIRVFTNWLNPEFPQC
ncbi:MAG TPA: hypothetical protein VGK82_13470 [Pyrinomonadaceae bacterium]